MIYICLVRFLLCILFLAAACQQKTADQSEQDAAGVKSEPAVFYFGLIVNPDSSFGYNIFQDSVLLIQQKTIPALTGNKGFGDSADAAATAAFAIHKLQSGVFPPTILLNEIDSLLKNQ